MKQTGTILALAGLASMAHGHGFVTSPKARMPGTAMQEACGQQVYNNQEADNYGNVQGELQIAQGQSDFDAEKCGAWLCKGYKFDDNKDNVYSYTSGQTVDFKVDIRAPHTGVANVSVVDTTSNSVIGSPLKSWDVYASTSTGVKDSETSFSVTLPDNLDSKCAEAGNCVLQWYWFAESIDQTYESCVDFTVGGSGSSGSSGSSSSAAATTAAASTSSAASSATSVAVTTTPSTGNKEASPSGFATSAKSTAAASATASSVSIPTDGTAEEKLNWIASLLQALVN